MTPEEVLQNRELEVRCKRCRFLIAKKNAQNWYEIKINGQNLSIAFPSGVVKCSRCNTMWVLDPYIPLNTKFQINYLRDEKFT